MSSLYPQNIIQFYLNLGVNTNTYKRSFYRVNDKACYSREDIWAVLYFHYALVTAFEKHKNIIYKTKACQMCVFIFRLVKKMYSLLFLHYNGVKEFHE